MKKRPAECCGVCPETTTAHDREVAAQAWQEGYGEALRWVGRQEDADAAGQYYIVPNPKNPYQKQEDDQ